MTRHPGSTTTLLDVRRGLPTQRGRARDGGDAQVRSELRTALAAGDLSVHLQPQVSLVDGRTVAVEALVRWEHPSRGVLVPRDVLPVADRAGLHGPLADAVLDLALGGAARWWSRRAPLPVAVNLAAANVRDLGLAGRVTAALDRHGLPPRALTLEVVEDAVAGPTDLAVHVLTEVRALGVAVAVDDYGNGRSALAALRRLPVDELKLDPALVADVAIAPRAAAIVRHVVALAHDLGLRVVAEGVEDVATLARLAELGCDAAQGFALAPAMPVDCFVAWLRERPADRLRPAAAVPQRRTA